MEKAKNVIIVVLVLAVIGLSGYLCYDKFLSNDKDDKPVVKETKEETTTEKGTEEKTTTEKEIEVEEKKDVVVYSVDDPKISKLIEKLNIQIECDKLVGIINVSKLESKNVSSLVAYHVALKNEFLNKGKATISLEEMNQAIFKYLGADYKFDPTSINYKGVSCPPYYYDKNSKTFKKQQTACGGACQYGTSYKIVKAVDDDGILKLDTRIVFVGDYYYSDYAKTKKIGKLGEDLNLLFEKGATYQFTFKLENGNYVFVSSEKI